MLSRYSTKVKVRVGLGIMKLVLAGILMYSFHHVLTALAWTCLVVGLALCIWGAISHAMSIGYVPPDLVRAIYVLPVAVGVYVAIVTFVMSATWLVFDLAELCLAPRLDAVAAEYPFIVVGLVVASLAAPYYSLLAAGATAPYHRFRVATVLGICHLCGSAFVLFVVFFAFNFGMVGGLWMSFEMWVGIPWIAGLVAVVLACTKVQAHEAGSSEREIGEIGARHLF